jgi:hypothetical protein
MAWRPLPAVGEGFLEVREGFLEVREGFLEVRERRPGA